MSRSRRQRDQRRARHARVRALMRPRLPDTLMAVWEHACWVWSEICDLFAAPAELAADGWLTLKDHREHLDWIRHLELLTRQLIVAAALAISVVLRPLRPRGGKRLRRRVILWPQRPETWRASFNMITGRPIGPDKSVRLSAPSPRLRPHDRPAFPLALRLEAVRRVLAAPDRRAHRFACRLARIAAANRTAEQPRLFALRPWPPKGRMTRGRHVIASAMALVHPRARDALALWNAEPEPG